jgi:hypothetical protein
MDANLATTRIEATVKGSVLLTFIALAAVPPFFRKKLTLSTGVFLFSLYLVGFFLQFFLV